MSTEALGEHSNNSERVWLKYPFVPNNGIKINAHTPLDEADEDKAVTQNDFLKNSKLKAKVFNKDDDAYSFGISNTAAEAELGHKIKSSADMIADSSVNSFQASNLSAKDIVGNAINKGRSVQDAYTVYKTQKAYKTSAGISKDPIKDLGSRKFKAV